MAKKREKKLQEKNGINLSHNSKPKEDIRRFMVKIIERQDQKFPENEQLNKEFQAGQESKDEVQSKLSKTHFSRSIQKQLRMTDNSLKIYIPITKIQNFGLHNLKPEDPQAFFGKLNEKNLFEEGKKPKKQHQKRRHHSKKNKRIWDGMKQATLQRYIAKQERDQQHKKDGQNEENQSCND